MKIYLEIFFIIITVAIFGFLFFYSSDVILSPGSSQDLQNQVCFGPNCFFVKVADTETGRERGLMFQNHLNKDEGMLFIFDKEGIYPFWMKNTLIPLDIIWINKDKKVVFIKENNQPCSETDCPFINPEIEAKYVLEINAGISDKIGFKIGDTAGLGY